MGLIVTISLILTMIYSIPVGMALGIAAFLGMLYVSPDVLIMMPQKFISGLDSFPLLAPLFQFPQFRKWVQCSILVVVIPQIWTFRIPQTTTPDSRECGA